MAARLPPSLTALKDNEDSQKNNHGTLLTARYQVVPFVPELRAAELTNLETWESCVAPHSTSAPPTLILRILGHGEHQDQLKMNTEIRPL